MRQLFPRLIFTERFNLWFRFFDLDRGKEVELPRSGVFPTQLPRFNNPVGGRIKRSSRKPEAVQCPRPDQPFDCPPVEVSPLKPGAEIKKAFVCSSCFPFFNQPFDYRRSKPFDRFQSDPDAVSFGGKAGKALIHIRREDRDSRVFAGR